MPWIGSNTCFQSRPLRLKARGFLDFQYFAMGREEELEKEIKELEAQLRDREVSLPAHSVRPQQILVIEELEAGIVGKKKELVELRRKRESGSRVD